MNYISRIWDLDKLDDQGKNVYSTLIAEWDLVQEVYNSNKGKNVSLGEVRNILKRQIGVAPALLFTYSSNFESKETLVSRLEENFS